jgi:transcriptional regulator with XRE-family HTH domain
MAQTNTLTQAPPYAVEKAIKTLGKNLRTARLRRNLTIKEVGEKIGTGPRPVADAEKGKPTTAMAVYVALLWTYDLLGLWDALAAPSEDMEGLALAETRERARTQASKDLDDDF